MASASEWQTAYEAVVLETDDSRLNEKLREARAAILSRLRELTETPGHFQERKALQNAIDALAVLCRERVDSYRAECL